MKLNSDLLNEVIADAKAVRETAVQTAISRLRETFEPTVRNLISQRLREEDEIEDDGDGMEDTAPVAPPAPESSPEDMVAPVAPAPEDDLEEELEFDVDSYTDDTYEDDDIFEDEYLDNGDEDEDFLAQILSELDEEVGTPEDVEDPMIPEEEEMMSTEGWMKEGEYGEEEISEEDLDEMIAELEGEMESEEEEMPAPAMESRRRNGKKLRENWVNNWGDDEYDSQNDYVKNSQLSENRKLKAQLRKANAQLKEAYRAINAQKTAINEVNLLNSKLLFLTKITSKHQLTPDKQIKVLEAFDRAKTVREVKLIYATIAESLNKTKTKGIMESASRPARAVKKSLNEQFAFAPRWQELAGISK